MNDKWLRIIQVIIGLALLLQLFGCYPYEKERYCNGTYWELFPDMEPDSDLEHTAYTINRKLNYDSADLIIVKEVLIDKKVSFHISTKGDVLVSVGNVPNLYMMYYLNQEISEKLKNREF